MYRRVTLTADRCGATSSNTTARKCTCCVDGWDGMDHPLLVGGLLGADGFIELRGGLVGRLECVAPPSSGPQLTNHHHCTGAVKFHHQKLHASADKLQA
ncbi:hypothetical protein E2C01_026051 [Portunus trituberculatus]|uniref:Uncharacterized protein n=1 Tax=Portunus trituberculatus TaxID=210409 RepID=A0A5B7EH52_PORTR|nr:hypothetical protein [Portunus trituberculatus]